MILDMLTEANRASVLAASAGTRLSDLPAATAATQSRKSLPGKRRAGGKPEVPSARIVHGGGDAQDRGEIIG